MITELASLAVGVASGVAGTVGFNMLQAKAARKKAEASAKLKALQDAMSKEAKEALKAIDSLYADLNKNITAELLQKAMDISAKQSLMKPTQSQDAMLAYNELELEKLDLLKTILKQGQNPLITIRIPSGEHQQVPLSAYVESIQKTLN